MAIGELRDTIIRRAPNLDCTGLLSTVHTSKGRTLFQSTPLVKDNCNGSSDSDRYDIDIAMK